MDDVRKHLRLLWITMLNFTLQMNQHETYMRRALELAALGLGHVAPNPMVGALLVYENRIIGEGYHQLYGGPHAEVNCIASVKQEDRALIAESILYVTLEPCCHFGKTPPCTALILKHGIKKVVIASLDPFEKVNGSGYQQLIDSGVEVICGVLEKEARFLNRRFFTFHQEQRPYIILKWAVTADGYISGKEGSRMKISNANTDMLVHRWRSEEQGIFAGTQTILTDNPMLTNRHWTGKQPVRMTIDRSLRIPNDFNIYNADASTVIFNDVKDDVTDHLQFVKIERGEDLYETIRKFAYKHQIQSIIVEGGRKILDYFLHKHQWDEIRRINANEVYAFEGIKAPDCKELASAETISIGNDSIEIIYR